MNQKAALALGVLAGAAATVLFGRRRPRGRAGKPADGDPRASELRRKLAEAREAGVDEREFEAAGMGPETILAEDPGPSEPLPSNEFEAMRRRVHEEARAAADEMRRRAETDD